MEQNIIIVKKAVALIKNNKLTHQFKVDFKNQKVDALDAILLGKNGIEVPEEIIEYDDDKIDFSDIPEITDKDISDGKIKWTVNADIPLDKEVTDWLSKENININEFAAKLIRNFYENINSLPKNAAM